ncbi:MAG: efflux RND transporter periplasmic adaptor subunit [Opitutaceae bacterium]
MTTSQRLLNLVLLPAVILLAFLAVKAMIASKPERVARTPKPIIPSVTYIESSPESITPTITTYGNIRSFYEAQLSAQVGGEIQTISPSFNSGQIVNKGDVLVEIDPADYLAAIAQQEAALASAEQALAEEKTRSELAAQDWTESGRAIGKATDLTLRKPQLGAAKASVASALASLQKAQLDLKRTKIKAPFDAIVQSRSASPGNVVNSGTILGALIAKERAEVRLPLTPTQVQRLNLPMSGMSGAKPITAKITTPTQPNQAWTARIARTEPSVNQQNQVIYVVGEIEAPFEDPDAFLPIGAFVDATLPAATIENAHRIPNTALVEDVFVWTITADNTLSKAPVTRVIADGDDLIVRFNTEQPEPPYRIATRPLASFRVEQAIEPIALIK